jgi:hypothetical protein
MWELADNEWVRVHPVTGGVHIEVIRITGAVIDTREWPILSPIGPSLLSHGSCLDDYAIRNQMGHGNKWHLFDVAIGDLLERMDKLHGKNPDAMAQTGLWHDTR